MKKRLPPIGTQDYHKLRMQDYYTVDKSLMIQEFLQRSIDVTLITRPRRFGKTLNMSMMAEFFDITKDSKAIFEGLAIMDTPYAKEMNQHPVIFISLANCKETYTILKVKLYESLRAQYAKYRTIFEKDELDADLLDRVRKTYNELVNFGDMEMITSALYILSEFLFVVYKKKPMIFIDEYDTPFIEAHTKDFYNEVHGVLASLMRTTLKGNEYMQYAMITGIQRVAKENVFSDLNNLKVYTVYSKPYAQYFGFTVEETQALLAYYDMPYSDEVKQMYDGYNMGGIEVYNPWSIMNYAEEKELIPYWVNTSGNSMIKKAMRQSDIYFKEGFETLIEQGYLETQINIETSFYEQSDTKNLWGLFVNAGYVTIDKTLRMNKYRIRIPNDEVKEEFMSLTAHHLKISDTSLTDLFSALEEKKKDVFIQKYRSILLSMPSYNDLNNENSYHMLMLGMCAWLRNDYKIISNREEGKGRCDILLDSKLDFLPSFVIEFKFTKKAIFEKDSEILKKLAHEAILQIQEEKYDYELTGEIIYIGLAHAGKDVAMEWVEK